MKIIYLCEMEHVKELRLDWKDVKSLPETVPSGGLLSSSVPKGTGGA